MSGSESGPSRKSLGAWYTPPALVEVMAEQVTDGLVCVPDRPLRVLDPACGDGRLLSAVADRIAALGGHSELVGCDVDPEAVASIDDPRIEVIEANALAHHWGTTGFDIVVGNPPFLSQMATGTTRGGASRHGGGPYADAAVEFLALAHRLANADGGRVALVLPQSVLGARDADPVREAVGRDSALMWSWWEPRQRHFDASVNVCIIGLERGPGRHTSPDEWTRVVTDRLGVPRVAADSLQTTGVIGDRMLLNANFRDEYYALVPAVSDEADGPPLVTSGLIDPGICHWGARSVRFAKQTFDAPRVDLTKLHGRFVGWADRKLVPKVLIANQTRAIEAVADPDGIYLPGVPVITATPQPQPQLFPTREVWRHQEPPNLTRSEVGDLVWETAAICTSPVATVLAWQLGAGTGLSTASVRLGPTSIGALPWPAGHLNEAVASLRAGDVIACGRSVCTAYGIEDDDVDALVSWWSELLPDVT